MPTESGLRGKESSPNYPFGHSDRISARESLGIDSSSSEPRVLPSVGGPEASFIGRTEFIIERIHSNIPSGPCASGGRHGGRFHSRRTCLVAVVTVTLILLSGSLGSLAYPTPSLSKATREFIDDATQKYLMKYGYLPMSDVETGNLRTESQLRDAVRMLQHYGAIPVTGIVDEATKKLMNRPRCALPDLGPEMGLPYPPQFQMKHKELVRNFVKQGSRWEKLNLTWGIRTYPRSTKDRTGREEHLSKWQMQREFRLAAEVWARPSKLRFVEIEEDVESADIVIDFRNGYHGDGYPFDGPGRTLAHAFYPGRGIGGDMHFDSEERWIQQQDLEDVKHTHEGISLFITAAHELGHALGFFHSDVEDSIMNPYLMKFPLVFTLPEDDVRGIQELYGVNENWMDKNSPPPTHRPETTSNRPPSTKFSPTRAAPPRQPGTPTEKPATCDTDYDAISVIRREIYVFKGKYFWRLDSKVGLRPHYPVEITRFWTMLPPNLTHIDAVYERNTDANIVFFIGRRYYVCEGNDRLLETGPLQHLGLPEDLAKIDAAFIWGHNRRTYFFAETMYWRFDESIQYIELDYPRDMAMWRGIPYHIDSAFKYQGITYFFKGKVFWEFDDLRMKAKPKSPTLSAPFWFNCPNNMDSSHLGVVTDSIASEISSGQQKVGAPAAFVVFAVLLASGSFMAG